MNKEDYRSFWNIVCFTPRQTKRMIDIPRTEDEQTWNRDDPGSQAGTGFSESAVSIHTGHVFNFRRHFPFHVIHRYIRNRHPSIEGVLDDLLSAQFPDWTYPAVSQAGTVWRARSRRIHKHPEKAMAESGCVQWQWFHRLPHQPQLKEEGWNPNISIFTFLQWIHSKRSLSKLLPGKDFH